MSLSNDDWGSLEMVLEAFWIQEAKRAAAGCERTAEQGIQELCHVLSQCFDPGLCDGEPVDTANSAINVLKLSAVTPESNALVQAFKAGRLPEFTVMP